MPKTDWLVDTMWYHVVSTNQSALCIDFTMIILETIQSAPGEDTE